MRRSYALIAATGRCPTRRTASRRGSNGDSRPAPSATAPAPATRPRAARRRRRAPALSALAGAARAGCRRRAPASPGRSLGAAGEAALRRADRRPRRPRPRLHPREPAALAGCWRRSGSAARSATSATSPRTGPVLLVGNHSGGNMTPDTIVFTLAFYDLLRRRAALLPARPQPRPRLARRADPAPLRDRRRLARARRSEALEAGAAVLVYPGGDWEVHRPELGGQQGRLRRPQGLHPPRARRRTCRSSRWSRSAARRRRSSSAAATGSRSCSALDRLLRLKVLPISIALPWGLNVGDFLGHIPLPAKITIEVLPPIDLREQFGPEPDVDEVYEHVTGVMQDDARRARRRAPLPGDRLSAMRLNESIVDLGARRSWSGTTSPSPRTTSTSCPGSPAGRSRASSASGLGARYRMLIRVGSAEVGGLIEIVECHRAARHGLDSVTGVDQRGRWRLREAGDGPHPGRAPLRLRRRRRRDPGLDLRARRGADGLRRHLRRSLQQLKRQVEHEQLRAEAARRRAEREAARRLEPRTEKPGICGAVSRLPGGAGRSGR